MNIFNMKPSFSLIFCGLFLAFILHSIWNLYLIFQPPICQPGEICYASYLNVKPQLDLLVYTTDNSKSGNTNSILSISNFNYDEQFERLDQVCE